MFDSINFLQVCGVNGNSLIGGQRQRVAICRAVYADSDIYLFDDVLSSLDLHVADSIFEKLIVNFLIPRGKTVLMATSKHRYFTVFPQGNILQLENGLVHFNQNMQGKPKLTNGMKKKIFFLKPFYVASSVEALNRFINNIF